jgi:hypothetical protein
MNAPADFSQGNVVEMVLSMVKWQPPPLPPLSAVS